MNTSCTSLVRLWFLGATVAEGQKWTALNDCIGDQSSIPPSKIHPI